MRLRLVTRLAQTMDRVVDVVATREAVEHGDRHDACGVSGL